MSDQNPHKPIDSKTYNKGAIADLDKEFLSRLDPGFYLDAFNMRPYSITGDDSALNSIRGEELLFIPQVQNPERYRCIGAIGVIGDIVAIYADEQEVEPPFMSVNGQVMLRSPLLPYIHTRRLKMDRNEGCRGGEVYIVDGASIPMIFNIGDIKQKFFAGSQQYFEQFNPAQYYISIPSQLGVPVFRSLIQVGAGSGQPVGSMAYSYRMVSNEGDRTNWSFRTPPIRIPREAARLESSAYTFPGVRLRGDSADEASRTRYAPSIRIRIDNVLDMDAIEIRRTQVVTGEGVVSDPEDFIIKRIPIVPGQNNHIDFVDTVAFQDAESIPSDLEERENLFIRSAGAVRYFDNRVFLADIEFQSRTDVDLSFTEIDGKKLVPITKDLGEIGYRDPVNDCYYKRLTSDEKYGFYVNVFDQAMSRGFSFPIPGHENELMPMARDRKEGQSLALSDRPLNYARVDNTIGPTFEIIEQGVRQKSLDRLVNVVGNAVVNGTSANWPSQAAGTFDPDTGTFLLSNGFQNYKPLTPTPNLESMGGDEVDGHLISPNNGAVISLTGINQLGGLQGALAIGNHQPAIHAPRVQSLGIAVHGVSGFPDWAYAFAITRTKSAGRVVCKGMAMHRYFERTDQPAGKRGDIIWAHFPDIIAGLVPQEDLDDLRDNPSSYALRFDAPVGYSFEIYAGRSPALDPSVPDSPVLDSTLGITGADVLASARVYQDTEDVNRGKAGQLSGVVPQDPTDPSQRNHVGYSAFRALVPEYPSSPFASADQGATTIGITSFSRVTNPVLQSRVSHTHELRLDQQLYQFTETTEAPGGIPRGFNHSATRRFNEPFYRISIVKLGSEAPQGGNLELEPTSEIVFIRSRIGIGNGQSQQDMILVHERPEDCFSSGPGDYSYVWVSDSQGEDRAWLCRTGNPSITAATVVLIVAAISANGFWISPDGTRVYGLYGRYDQDGDSYVRFGSSGGPQLPIGASVYVKYNGKTVKGFRGDSFVSERTFAPIDCNESNGYFNWNRLPLLYPLLGRNPLFLMPRNAPSATNPNSLNRVEQWSYGGVETMRQLVVLYDSESRCPSHYSSQLSPLSSQSYPGINYIQRLSSYNPNLTASENGLFGVYDAHFPSEVPRWTGGGFRCYHDVNLDYAVDEQPRYLTIPDGFKEITKHCSLVVWTLRRTALATDSPSLRTILDTNQYFASDNYGPIRMLWSTDVDSTGNNLYAIADTRIAILPTNKLTAYGAGSEQFTMLYSDDVISSERWLPSEVGCPGSYWELAAEGGDLQSGNIRSSSLFFPNESSVYQLTQNTIRDISVGKYNSKLLPSLSRAQIIAERRAAMYTPLFNEYWMMSVPERTPNTADAYKGGLFVYAADPKRNAWIGRFAYRFDRFLSYRGKLYGFRQGAVYLLESGGIINGQPITAYADQVSSPKMNAKFEYIQYRASANRKPTRVEFRDQDGTLWSWLDASLGSSNYLRDVDGWMNWIPRRLGLAVGTFKARLQGKIMFFRTIHTGTDPFKLVSTDIQLKKLK